MTQTPLFQPEAEWRAPVVSELPSWAGARRVGLDIETHDPHLKKLGPGFRRGAYVVGVSFAIEDGPSGYLPIRHGGGDNLDATAVLGYLRAQAESFTGTIAGANLSYDLDGLAQEGVVFRRAKWFRDVQIADPLINELHDSYSLQAIADRWGIPGKDETQLRDAASAWGVNPKHGLSALPARYVADYAVQDAVLPLQLLRRQERAIDDQDLWEVYDLESRVLPVLVKMRRRGVRIDTAKLQHVYDWAESEERRLLQEVYDETRVRIKVGEMDKKGPVAQALESVGVVLSKTPSGQPKIDKNTLEHLDHPIGKLLNQAKKMSKLRTTFCRSVWDHMTDGRVHCTFNQLRKTTEDESDEKGARYGRLSSSDPNLQQQPSRDPWANLWRSIYVPDGDGMWACCDFSQQEPRVLVHYAELMRLRGAREAAERYRRDPKTDNHTLMAQMIYGYGENEKPSKEHRTHAKIIFLGLCYSMGGGKLATDLGLPTVWKTFRGSGRQYLAAGPEAQAILDQFNRQVPFVKMLAEKCAKRAEERGYITTLLNRRCRFPEIEPGEYDFTHKALNRLIQGGAADQTKKAMVDADAAGFKLQLQVHDELDQTVESRRHAEELGEVMRNAVPLNVPARVDVELGPSWGEIKEVA